MRPLASELSSAAALTHSSTCVTMLLVPPVPSSSMMCICESEAVVREGQERVHSTRKRSPGVQMGALDSEQWVGGSGQAHSDKILELDGHFCAPREIKVGRVALNDERHQARLNAAASKRHVSPAFRAAAASKDHTCPC
eukprot:3487029-Rhodomonas_salina.2